MRKQNVVCPQSAFTPAVQAERDRLLGAGHGWRCRIVSVTLAMLVILSLGAIERQPIARAAATATECPNASLRTGPSAALPDCRAYEQVSPVSKNGFAAVLEEYPAVATANGEKLAYLSLGSFEAAESASFPDAYVASRSASGWGTTNVSPPTPDATPPGGDPITYDFSETLSQVAIELPLQQLASGATPEVSNLFLSGATGEGYSWVNDVQPHVLLPEGCPIPQFLALCWQVIDQVAFAGASVDFRHILFESTESLASGAPEGRENLYESSVEGGKWHVTLVGILPDEAVAEGSTAGGGSNVNYATVQPQFDKRVANAISEDGSRVVFEAPADAGGPDSAQSGSTEVYDRIDGSETVELSAPAPSAKPKVTTPESATFWGASTDGSRVFFTSTAELTTSSYTGSTAPTGQDLYEYNVETETLKDLTVDTNLPADEAEGAAVQGVVGVSRDGSYVYFVASGQLVPGKGVDHSDNLYMVHDGGAPVYIATLNASDEEDWTERAASLESYVTPDGTHVGFTSVNSLPATNFPAGYNNVNPNTSTPEREVYEYNAPSTAEEESGLTGSLVCASCDPSGTPPIGGGLLGGVSRREESHGTFGNTPFHQVRAVSADGLRVFFSSPDPLTPAVKGNTHAKVYEYEQAREGSCVTQDGCVYLLSSPTSQHEAFFMDADEEGNNCFFATTSQMTSSDHDNLRDVYDARVDGGLTTSPTKALCRNGCRMSSTEATPTSAPISGSVGPSGNLVESPKHTVKETKAEKLAKALKACRIKKHKRLRRSCEVEVRKRYTPRAKKPDNGGHGRGK